MVAYLQEAGVLLVGGAEAAVIRADVIGTHVEVPKFLTGIQIAANTFVLLNVGGNAHLLPPVLGAALEHVHASSSKTILASMCRRQCGPRLRVKS
jgi:hypothetical protein